MEKKISPQIALTITQMKALHKLGLHCSDASLAWAITKTDTVFRVNLLKAEDAIMQMADQEISEMCFTYTLEDIILKLHADITYNETIANDLGTFDGQHREITPWQCYYTRLVGWDNLIPITAAGTAWGKTPIEAAYNALKEVLEHFPDKIKSLER